MRSGRAFRRVDVTGIISDFKEFAIKGNALDMAVGIVIGAGFGKIVSSLVSDVITPPLGVLLGGVDFRNLGVVIKKGSEGIEPVVLKYGIFLQATFDFLIVAFVLFLLGKGMNTLKRKQEEAPAALAPTPPSAEELLLREIRDLLKR